MFPIEEDLWNIGVAEKGQSSRSSERKECYKVYWRDHHHGLLLWADPVPDAMYVLSNAVFTMIP